MSYPAVRVSSSIRLQPAVGNTTYNTDFCSRPVHNEELVASAAGEEGDSLQKHVPGCG